MDAGPVVAYFCASEARHNWAVQQFEELSAPMLTCKPVLTESSFLLRRQGVPAWRLLEKVSQGAFRIALRIDAEAGALQTLMERYRKQPKDRPADKPRPPPAPKVKQRPSQKGRVHQAKSRS